MSYPPATVQTVLPVLPIPSLYGQELDWLRAMIVNPSIALNYLETVELHLKLRSLYQHFFPFEFRLSTASRYWESEQHSEEELEFFDLIHDRLFHLPIDGDESFCTGIPIFSITPDFWYEEYEWGELDILEQLLLGLSGQEDWDMVEQTFFAVPLLKPTSPSQIDWNQFKLNCEAMPAPLNYFHIAVQIFDRETANPFIDSHDYEFFDFWTWSVEAIEELTRYYQKAVQLQQKAQVLVNWLTDNPYRLIQLIELWNRSVKPTPTRPSIKTIQSSQLGQNWSVRRIVNSSSQSSA